MTSPDTDLATLLGNVEAGLRLLLKSDKPLYVRAAEVGIEDLHRVEAEIARLREGTGRAQRA